MRKSSFVRRSSIFSQPRRSSIWGSSRVKRRASKVPRKGIRVFNDEGKDVTPRPLSQAVPIDESQPSRHFLDEVFTGVVSDPLKSISSSSLVSCSSIIDGSQRHTVTSLTTDSDESVYQLDKPTHPVTIEVLRKRDDVKEHLTEEMLDEVVNICITETDTISLLDIPSTFISKDADDAEAILERNRQYTELCKSKVGNDKYVARSTQTCNEAPKDKQIQTKNIAAVEEETIASVCDIYDSFTNQIKTPESGEMTDFPETSMHTSEDQENRKQSICSIADSALQKNFSSSTQLEMDMCENSLKSDSDLQLIMLTESFKSRLLVMERSIVAKTCQTKLAAYRQLPILEDPDSTVKPGTEEQSEEGAESSSSPMLEHLLAFTCTLTTGCNITSMTWNKKNLNILAVGYGDFDSKNKKPSLICCWCLKNPTWPERVIHCHSCVISMDFSSNNPSQLAVGMDDGTMAIYDVSQSNVPCIADSRNCFKKHLHPVWHVNWIIQGLTSSGENMAESLISVSADGRISKWFLCSSGLDCIDLMKKKAERKKTDQVLPFMGNPGLCVDFHPADHSIYVVGTWEGLIQRGCVSNNQHFLETYQKHFCPVNQIEWSPFNSELFLSCSSDWTIQMWKKDLPSPVMSFISTQKDVHAVTWSPNCSTVFAAHNGEQVEIWDLNRTTVYPSIVHRAADGVRVTSMLFTRGIDGILVGDSNGQVTVYEIKNLNMGEDEKMDSLEDIIKSAGK